MSHQLESLFPEILGSLEDISVTAISAERKRILQELVEHLNFKRQSGQPIRLNFICSHNSRRSQLCQLWAQSLAYHFNVPETYCYSGGTEETEVAEFVIQTIKQSGFRVNSLSVSHNKIYAIQFASNAHPLIAFSKKFDHPFNPESAFVAIMTCTEADKECPTVRGAEKQFSLPYEDPKQFEQSTELHEQYRKINLQIASELFYVFSQLKT